MGEKRIMAGRRLLLGNTGPALAAPGERAQQANSYHAHPAGRQAMQRMGAAPLVMPVTGYEACLRRNVETLARSVRDAGIRPD
jgi:hypothetical protein